MILEEVRLLSLRVELLVLGVEVLDFFGLCFSSSEVMICFCLAIQDGVQTEFQVFTGFGYISATDEYKILIATSKRGKKGEGAKIRIFSSKSNSWKRIQDSQYFVLSTTFDGTLLNEALHWLRRSDVVIVAFDLADEEFRTMPLPVVEDHYAGGYFRHLGDFGGCLCVFGQADTNAGSMDLWVMREYDAGNSWTKLFNLKFSDQPEQINFVKPIWVMETSTFMEVRTNSERDPKWVRSYHKEEKIEEIHMKENIFKRYSYGKRVSDWI
ncbi:hypothetical protein J5N97_001958 [Dioscorea zingiberensis]|uniref:F-box associated beta-propeller type 1 domain-containing protein n=1 Tax=Dioscorea zingiberensis TaxID=325984 RepID=A0A9D5BTF9_9LILI|nr:hypothetical protein J5N97_001958 [Dioscorea zingiberensis]